MSADAPVAEWDFRRRSRPLVSLDGRLTLRNAAGSHVASLSDGVVGRALSFDGRADHLVIPAADVGDLHVAASGDEVSVFALVRRRSEGTGFIAGMWQEDDGDPRRQYGLFIDLPTYGGAEQVIGHVSSTGGPSAGLPYSRDYSATARMIGYDEWRVIGFTYDGTEIRSFLDGVTDLRPTFTERQSPLGEGLTYAKNPFHYPDGLNRRSISDFTVGAVRLTGEPGNFFGGQLARLAVWRRALSPAEAMTLARSWTPALLPVARFDFVRPREIVGSADGGWDDPAWPLEVVGWRQIPLRQPASRRSGASPFVVEAQHSFVVEARHASPHLSRVGPPPHPPTLVFVEHLAGVEWRELARLQFRCDDVPGVETEGFRAAVRLDGRWFTTARDLPRTGGAPAVVPGDEHWIPLERAVPATSSAARADEVADVEPDPGAAVSAIGFVAWGDGASVRLASVSVFVGEPAQEPV